MTTPDLDTAALEHAADLLAASRYVVVLAGAGMSKESGIPTFRGEGGLWTTRGEPPLNQYEHFRDDPRAGGSAASSNRPSGDEFATALEAAQPNAGHFALAELEAVGVVGHVITQNIDDLHRRAGQRQPHRDPRQSLLDALRPLRDALAREEFPIDAADLPPRCASPGCDGIVKGDTRDVRRADPALARSLAPPRRLRWPTSSWSSAPQRWCIRRRSIPLLAAQRGLPLIEVNPEPTPLSPLASVVLRGALGRGAAAARRGGAQRDGATTSDRRSREPARHPRHPDWHRRRPAGADARRCRRSARFDRPGRHRGDRLPRRAGARRRPRSGRVAPRRVALAAGLRPARPAPTASRDAPRSARVAPDGTLYLGLEPAAMLRSEDGGETWANLEGVQNVVKHARQLRAATADRALRRRHRLR